MSTILVLMVVGVAELILAAAKPCVMSSRLYSEECGSTVFWIFAIVVPFKGIVAMWVGPASHTGKDKLRHEGPNGRVAGQVYPISSGSKWLGSCFRRGRVP